MKKLCYFLVFLVIGTTCFSQKTKQLPDTPWKDIVEISRQNDPSSLAKWLTDINVKLEGSYTKADSVAIAKILIKLDALTETISIKFSKFEKPNLTIHFFNINSSKDISKKIDIEKDSGELTEITTTALMSEVSFETSPEDGSYRNSTINIFKNDKYIDYKNSLEPKIAKVLVGGYFLKNVFDDTRISIFNYKNRDSALSNEDKAIIKEVYRKDFEERLEKAKNQFANVKIKKEKIYKITNRDRSLWWVNNPHAVLLIPTIILLIVFISFVLKINQLLSSKIKNGWFRFAIVIFTALLLLDVLLISYSYFYNFLTIEADFPYSGLSIMTIIEFTLIAIILFPTLFLLRFIEIKIRESKQQIFMKTMLIFLSTGFLPFIALTLYICFSYGFNRNNLFLYASNTLYLSKAFLYIMIIASIRALISYFIFKERNLIIENETKLASLRELKVKAELKSLQSQINPHFLYNSLNSIASLAPIDAQKTQKMAHSLSDLFKYSINRKDKKTSTVHDEVEMVKTYLDIEKIRFGDRLQFSVAVNQDLENYEIPLFLIQPLVENAVKHGISKNEGVGEIDLKISKQENEIVISVSDNGPDFPEGLLSGHGLQTVFDLLRLTYGDKASLNWTNAPEKMIIITIPEAI